MTVEIACLYTSWAWPSRRSRTQKLSNQVILPCSLTPLTRKMVTGDLLLRTALRNVSCRFCCFSLMGFPTYQRAHQAGHCNQHNLLLQLRKRKNRNAVSFRCPPFGHTARESAELKVPAYHCRQPYRRS